MAPQNALARAKKKLYAILYKYKPVKFRAKPVRNLCETCAKPMRNLCETFRVRDY